MVELNLRFLQVTYYFGIIGKNMKGKIFGFISLGLFSLFLIPFTIFPVDAAVFVDSFDVSGQDTQPTDVSFNTDGTKMFVIGIIGQDVNEYNCTAFDVSTCIVDGGAPLDVSLQESQPRGLEFNTDGTKMFVIGENGDEVNEYACTTGFDVSTCTPDSLFSVAGEEAIPRDFVFNTDGTKMFVLGAAGVDVNEYTLSIGFDISSTVTSIDAKPVSGQLTTFPNGLAFNTDGTKMFVIGSTTDDVNEYACTAFDVSTCTFVDAFDVSGQENHPRDVAFNTDGTKMYVVGLIGQAIYEYDLGIGFDISSVPESVTSETNSGGSSANKHKTKPTFGLDHNTFAQIVEGGFSFNGVSHDIVDNWWTPFAEQEVKIGTINSFTAKVYADKQLLVQEFLFGIPNVGEAHKAELGVEVFYDYSGDIDKVRVIQKTNIIDAGSAMIITSPSKCLPNDEDKKCVTTFLSMKFLEPLQDKVMAIKAIDFKGRVNITYLNEGFDISGDSLNPMKTMMIPGTEKYEGLIEITQTAKYSDVWATSDGRAFEINEYGTPKLIHQSVEDRTETSKNLDRYHSEFSKYKEIQINQAQLTLEQLCERCGDTSYDKIDNIFKYAYPESIEKGNDPQIQKSLEFENLKAKKILLGIYEKMYPTMIFDKTYIILD